MKCHNRADMHNTTLWETKAGACHRIFQVCVLQQVCAHVTFNNKFYCTCKRRLNTAETRQQGAVIGNFGRYYLNCLPWNENQRLTRNGCSRWRRMLISLTTFLIASFSKHWVLFMYFIAYIVPVSLFCTMQTWRKLKPFDRMSDIRLNNHHSALLHI